MSVNNSHSNAARHRRHHQQHQARQEDGQQATEQQEQHPQPSQQPQSSGGNSGSGGNGRSQIPSLSKSKSSSNPASKSQTDRSAAAASTPVASSGDSSQDSSASKHGGLSNSSSSHSSHPQSASPASSDKPHLSPSSSVSRPPSHSLSAHPHTSPAVKLSSLDYANMLADSVPSSSHEDVESTPPSTSSQSSTPPPSSSTPPPVQTPQTSTTSSSVQPQNSPSQSPTSDRPPLANTATEASTQQEEPTDAAHTEEQSEASTTVVHSTQTERVQASAAASTASYNTAIWQPAAGALSTSDVIFDPASPALPGDVAGSANNEQLAADTGEKSGSGKVSPGAAAGAVIGVLIGLGLLVWLYRTMMQKKNRARMHDFASRASFFAPPAKGQGRGVSTYGTTSSEDDWTPNEKNFAPPPVLPLNLRARDANASAGVDRGMMDFLAESRQNPRDLPSRASTPLWMREAGNGKPPAAEDFSPPRLSIVAPSESSQGTYRYNQSGGRLTRAASTDSGNHLHPPNPFLKMRVPSPTLEVTASSEALESPKQYRAQYTSPLSEVAEYADYYVQEADPQPDSPFSSRNPYRNSADVRSSVGQSTMYRQSMAGRSEMDSNPFELEPDLAHITYLNKLTHFSEGSSIRDSTYAEEVRTPTTVRPEQHRHSTSSSIYTTEQSTRMGGSPAYSGFSSPQPPEYDASSMPQQPILSSRTATTEAITTDNSARSSLMGKAM